MALISLLICRNNRCGTIGGVYPRESTTKMGWSMVELLVHKNAAHSKRRWWKIYLRYVRLEAWRKATEESLHCSMILDHRIVAPDDASRAACMCSFQVERTSPAYNYWKSCLDRPLIRTERSSGIINWNNWEVNGSWSQIFQLQERSMYCKLQTSARLR